jgi:hypothetical protein
VGQVGDVENVLTLFPEERSLAVMDHGGRHHSDPGVAMVVVVPGKAHTIMMLDGDEVGKSAAAEIADRLQRVVYQVHLLDLPDGVQPDQLSSDELYRLLDWIPSMR